MEKFDYAIIGAGPGGYVSAIRAAQLGLKTVLIEKDKALGGCCLNVGCIPSKSLLESSEWYAGIKHKSTQHGIDVSDVQIDIATMMERKTRIVKTLTDGVSTLMKKNGVTVINGIGQLIEPGRINVDTGNETVEIKASAITLAMGSVPVELPFMPFHGRRIVNSTTALDFDEIPEHLVVVGGGAIGLELGSVWCRLGAKVTVIEMLPQIAPFADKQMAVMLARSLKSQGLEIHVNSRVIGAEINNGITNLTFEDKNGNVHRLESDCILVAIGRKPFSENAGLREIGINIENNGGIAVDNSFQTNIPGIYAIGDLIRGPMLAHKAEEEGVAVAEIIAGKEAHINYDIIPNVIYTSPELAVVGINEEEAKVKGIAYKTGKFYFKGNGRALSLGETDGLVKIIADNETDQILGVHILGPRASDMIAEAVTAMRNKMTATDLGTMIHAHPTLSEAVKEAALSVSGMSIHG
ncbi:MAG: dihydrolipoyl dehydrogenase [Calditrichaeota bacterium]|nr:dihydrolipoyl dehydrogenase [Calditrichota bacterium]